MKVFFDTEFTGLQQATGLISIGLIDEDGREFYGVNSSYTDFYMDEETEAWVEENVIRNLYSVLPDRWFVVANGYESLAKLLAMWLDKYDYVEMWGDVPHYDWVLFRELFDNEIPKNVYYIPFDLATLFKAHGEDPDISREAFCGVAGVKHNAAHDAWIIRACYNKLEEQK
ncbi:MAG TPA: 3'-5' exoribonuclease [Bellilinea sp.]|nr:3'-5' exoribonuclease [Bellilinea sp.]